MQRIYKIYVIKNTINNKIYIGQTVQSISRRFGQHKNKKHKGCKKIFNALNKYGRENFYIEQIMSAKTKKDINYLEEYFIKYFDSTKKGYNITKGGSNLCGEFGTFFGKKHLKKSIEKIKQSLVGVKHTDERRKNQSKARLGKEPWNKGTKGICKSNNGSFKSGQPAPKTAFKNGHMPPTLKKWSNDDLNKMKQLIVAGKLTSHIANEFSVSFSVIKRLIDNGII